ncbi:hypothetical protein IAR55_001887 [Kwoniella newhampshirensis]|uniref:EGF-like domain-containing protein n=1 Tax=Kwoniella newhampshirensis TaxID=1651941 RepID=A0AAW0Z3J4_9TREE
MRAFEGLVIALATASVSLAEDPQGGTTIRITSSNQVCSPSGCLQGKSSSPLLAHDSSARRYFLPGTYVSTTQLSPTSSLNASISHPPSDLNTLVVSPPPLPVGFTSPSYGNTPSVSDNGSWSLSDWRSVVLPEGWYAVLEGGNVIWGAIPEKVALPNSLTGAGILRAAFSDCNPPCSTHGICTSSDSSNATCQCAIGWSGPSCDSCASGYFGPSCTACASNCTICDGGVSGTGTCLSTAVSSQATCNCIHGTCTSSSECSCSAGWITNSTTSASSCNVCAPSFFQDSTGNCLACPLGCKSCELQPGTNSTANCLSCSALLSLSTNTPATCGSTAGSCSDGSYYDNGSSTCKSCSPACSTCTGPSTSDCLACASPREYATPVSQIFRGCSWSIMPKANVMLVPLDVSIATSPASQVQQALIRLPALLAKTGGCWNEGSVCGSAVMGCSSLLDLPRRTGLVSNATRPVRHASPPQLRVPLAPNHRHSPLRELVFLAVHPRRSLRTEHVFPVPPTVFPALHPPPAHHVPYLDLCIGPDSKSCTVCPDGYQLKEGECYALPCDHGGVAPNLGICLSALVQSPPKKEYLGFLALIVVIFGGGMGIWWYIKRERRQTRESTKLFGERLDQRRIQDRLNVLRLDSVLGLNRLRGGPVEGRDMDDGKYDEGKRRRFRELLLPSSRNRKPVDTEVEMESRRDINGRSRAGWSIPPPPYVPPTNSPVDHTPFFDNKVTPAPNSRRRDSLDSVPTPTRVGFPNARSHDPSPSSITNSAEMGEERERPNSTYMMGNTVVHSMSSSFTSSGLTPTANNRPIGSGGGGLLPPPRPGMVRQSTLPEKEREVRTVIGQGFGHGQEYGKGIDLERRLADSWPALGEGRRVLEG